MDTGLESLREVRFGVGFETGVSNTADGPLRHRWRGFNQLPPLWFHAH